MYVLIRSRLIKGSLHNVVPNEKNSRLGTYVSTTTAGETVRAFVPPPLPPELPSISLDYTSSSIARIKFSVGWMVSPRCFLTLTSFSIYMSARKPFFPHKSKVPSLPSPICSYLKTKQCPAFPSTMSKKSPATSLQCSTVFVASKGVFRSRCASFGRFTEFCCEADAGRTKHPANFAAHRIGLAEVVRETLRLFLHPRNA